MGAATRAILSHCISPLLYEEPTLLAVASFPSLRAQQRTHNLQQRLGVHMKGVIYMMPRCLLNCSSILKSKHNYFLTYLTFLTCSFTHCLFLLFLLLNHSFFSTSHSVFESKGHIAFITLYSGPQMLVQAHTSGFLKALYSTLNTKDILTTWSKVIRFPNWSCLLYSFDVNISSSGKKKKSTLLLHNMISQ